MKARTLWIVEFDECSHVGKFETYLTALSRKKDGSLHRSDETWTRRREHSRGLGKRNMGFGNSRISNR